VNYLKDDLKYQRQIVAIIAGCVIILSLALVLWNHLVQQHLFLVVDSEPLLSVDGRCLIYVIVFV
jgi:hypothetical protein